MNDNCFFCTYPCCDICPLGERDFDDFRDLQRDFDDFRDLQPDMYLELKYQDEIAGDVYE